MINIWNKVSTTLRNSIGQVFMTHLAYTALGVVLFAPLAGLVSHIPLYLTGVLVLADKDIITDEPELAGEVLVERSKMNSVECLVLHTSVLLGTPVPQRFYRDQSP